MSEEFDLQEKFPDLKPIDGTPSLSTVNGCGLVLYGGRDHDVETGTYIKTQCLAFLFIPILALRSFRVADSGDGGWYFIGREPLSGLARMWNMVLVVGVAAAVGLGSWYSHVSSPDYVAKQQLAEADELAVSQEWEPAAKKYAEVIRSTTPSSHTAGSRLDELYADAAKNASAADSMLLMKLGSDLWDQGIHIRDLGETGLRIVERFAETDASRAYVILGVVDRLFADSLEGDRPDAKRISAVRRKVLVGVVAAEPRNLAALGELAALHEADGKFDECKKLLEPHVKELGDTEGARILGQIYAREGNIDKAHGLLVPYCNQRLKVLHAAEKRFNDASTQSYETIVAELRQRRGHTDFLQRVNLLPEDQQGEAFQTYVSGKMKDDPAINRARIDLQQASGVARVAFDLGIVQLRRGRSLSDPVERKRELKRAEKTFLDIRGAAGHDDTYQLSLGQVYYWLGKEADGRKLFDELLATRKRAPPTLVAVGQTLRILGSVSEAKKLMEEAYNKSSDDEVKFSAAGLRAIMEDDLDEKVVWLNRGNPKDIGSQAQLNLTKGRIAYRDGRNRDAQTHYRKAISLYDKLPETSVTLNNSAIIWQALFRITNDSPDFAAAAQRLEKAITLSPTNAILISNTGGVLVQGAIQSIVQGKVDLKTSPVPADVDMLSYLYRNAQEREVFSRRVRDHAGTRKGIKYFNDVMLLAPKGAGSYFALVSLESFFQNTAGLRELKRKILAAKVDTADVISQTLEHIQGKKLDKSRSNTQKNISRIREAVEKTKSQKDVNFAIARATLANSLIELSALDTKVDPDEVVTLAEAAHRAAPSSATLNTLASAFAFRALQSLGKTNGRIRQATAKYRRILPARYLVAALLAHDETARKVLLQQPDIQKLLLLKRESLRNFPESFDLETWALLVKTDPKQAGVLANGARNKERTRLVLEIAAAGSPINPPTALSLYWLHSLEGNDAEAQKILDELKKHSIELPVGK